MHGEHKCMTFVLSMRVLRMEKRPSKKTTPPLTCDGQWTMDTRGRVVVPPPCVTPPNLPHPKTQTGKGSMEQSVHRPLSQSVCRAARRVHCRPGGSAPRSRRPPRLPWTRLLNPAVFRFPLHGLQPRCKENCPATRYDTEPIWTISAGIIAQPVEGVASLFDAPIHHLA